VFILYHISSRFAKKKMTTDGFVSGLYPEAQASGLIFLYL